VVPWIAVAKPASQPDDRPGHERSKDGAADADQRSSTAVTSAYAVAEPGAKTRAAHYGHDDPDPDFPVSHAEYPGILSLRD
jgi:hypothetical protein